jgi:predicted transcriptional regulator
MLRSAIRQHRMQDDSFRWDGRGKSMDTLYWLMFISGAIAVGVYARHWYNRPSGMPEILEVSYSYQSLKFIQFHVDLKKKSSEKNLISMTETIEPYLKKRNLNWRQRNDVIKYMLRADWVYEISQDGNKYYAIAEAGERELETADGLRGRAPACSGLTHL